MPKRPASPQSASASDTLPAPGDGPELDEHGNPIKSDDGSSETPTDPQGRKKVDVIDMLKNAHGEAHDVTIAQEKLAAANAARPMPSALEVKALRQLKEALSIFHEIRSAADNLRPAVSAAALAAGSDPRIVAVASVLNSLLIGIDKADDAIQKHLDESPE